MDEKIFIKAFGEAIRSVVRSMSGITLQVFRPESRKELPCFVTGTMGVTGDAQASVSLGFSKEAIEAIYRAVFTDEEEQGEISFSSIGDLVGELTGTVWGQARKLLADQNITVDASIPTVVLGDRQHLHLPSGTTVKIVPFIFDGKTLFVEMGIAG
jgi:chemotaxis protein CheX